MSLKVGVIGCAGRMGRALLTVCLNDADHIALKAAVVPPADPLVGQDISELLRVPETGVRMSDSLEHAAQQVDVLIDFTQPDVTLQTLKAAQDQKCAVVIGTTGFTDHQKQAIATAAKHIPIVYSHNMSIGVNVMYRLLSEAAKALGDEYDVEIMDLHHRHKVDAPSGAALTMGEIVAKALGRDLKTCAVYTRQGQVGARPNKAIGFSSVRAGEIVGEHRVIFAGPDEQLEIVHKAQDRMIFARGALKAAHWLKSRQPGLYTMEDVLFS